MSRNSPRAVPDSLAVLELRPTSRLGALARALAAVVTREVLEAVAEEDPRIRGAHLRVFATLEDGPRRASEIAERLGTTKQTIAPVIDELVSWGYLERTLDPADRRAKPLDFTDGGRRIARTALTAAESLDRDWESVLGKEELEVCRAALWRLLESRRRRRP
ncbi:MarR family winged helix-turn-helix transcriptional regulator [Nocardioides albidus]|uniref:MarR family winged helix-turn-helix transcriptional regulator n=1 Tax=Nocardioides albidus TaxID=1517589 RepID=UPI001305093F|nr:MarR family winged helix-turn-helix transcriptional regulator [Nocardioides albidus]